MHNAEKPTLEELPSLASLKRSALVAGVAGVAILVTVVLPAERAIDPTGIGRILGLTEMGEIKRELAEEAERDRLLHGGEPTSSLLRDMLGLFAGAAQAEEQAWADVVSFTLEPDASAEVKLVMQAGDVARYAWNATGGRINFDLHAHGDGQSVDYDRGRGAVEGEGLIEAGFVGEHGWFWRNRDEAAVTVTLQLGGAYSAIVETR
jgi:hypothetical protein